jgi:hypothetical protein
MLSLQQQELVRRHGIATLHDHQVNSIVNGEAFLEDGVLSYYDGQAVLVCGQSMRGLPAPSCSMAEAVTRSWLDRASVASLTYVGAEPIDLSWLRSHNFARDWVQPRIAREAELFLPADLAETRVMKRAIRNGFQQRHGKGGYIQAVHLDLIERFYRGLALTDYLAEVAIRLPAILLSPVVTIIEAWEHSTLRGFVVVHEPFVGLSHALFMAHDHTTRGVSDFLYLCLVEHATGVGSEFVNIGPSPTHGHYRFKRKWHAVPLVPPYYAAKWTLRGTHQRRPATAHRTWLLRLLGSR